MIMASSTLYPSKESTATTAFVPKGLSVMLRSSVDFVFTIGDWGLTSRCCLTKVESGYVGVENPSDCLAIADS